MWLRQHSTGFNQKGLKWKGGGLEESRHDDQDWEAIVLSSPAAFQSPTSRSVLRTPRAGTVPQPLAPSLRMLRVKDVERRCGKSPREGSGETVSILWATQDSSLPFKSYFMLLSSNQGFGWSSVEFLYYDCATVTFSGWPLSQIMVHFICSVWDEDQWLCTLLSALTLLSQSPSWLLNTILCC